MIKYIKLIAYLLRYMQLFFCLQLFPLWGYNVNMSKSNKEGHSEKKIRNVPDEDWALFQQYCLEEGARRGEKVTCSSMLREVIKVLGSRTKIHEDKDNQPELDL